jgi:WD40 repeat protein
MHPRNDSPTRPLAVLGLAGAGWALLLSAAAGQPPEDPFSPLAMAMSPDGRLLARTELIRRGSPGTETTVVDTRTGKPAFKVRSDKRTLYALAFSPDGRLLALSGGDNVETNVWHGEVKVVRTDTGQEVLSRSVKNGILRYLAFSADGKRLATRTSDAITPPEVLVLEVPGGKVRQVVRPGEKRFDGRPLPEIWLPAFHPDGRLLLLPGAGGKVYEAEKGRTVYEVKLRRGRGLRQIVFSPDGRRVALVEQTASLGPGEVSVNDPGVVHVCDAATGRLLRTLQGHARDIRCAAFSPDGRYLVTGSADRTARVWDADTGKELGTQRGHRARITAVAFTPTGRLALSADADSKVRVWDRGAGPGGKR